MDFSSLLFCVRFVILFLHQQHYLYFCHRPEWNEMKSVKHEQRPPVNNTNKLITTKRLLVSKIHRAKQE